MLLFSKSCVDWWDNEGNVDVVRETIYKNKNDVWASRRPNCYQILFQIPSFVCLSGSRRMFVVATVFQIFLFKNLLIIFVLVSEDDHQIFWITCWLCANATSYLPLSDRLDSGVANSRVSLTLKGATNVGRSTLFYPSVKIELSFPRQCVPIV